MSEFGPEPLSVIITAVVSFLDRAYLKTFLTENGKKILCERFSQGLPARPIDGDDLIQAFAGRLTMEDKRRFAWAVMTLVGENCISSKREAELVAYIIREAEQVFRDDLKRNPKNPRSLWGLSRALRAQKKNAAPTVAEFQKSWRGGALKLEDL